MEKWSENIAEIATAVKNPVTWALIVDQDKIKNITVQYWKDKLKRINQRLGLKKFLKSKRQKTIQEWMRS